MKLPVLVFLVSVLACGKDEAPPAPPEIKAAAPAPVKPPEAVPEKDPDTITLTLKAEKASDFIIDGKRVCTGKPMPCVLSVSTGTREITAVAGYRAFGRKIFVFDDSDNNRTVEIVAHESETPKPEPVVVVPQNLSEALALYKSDLSDQDVDEEFSLGAVKLALWGIEGLKWDELALLQKTRFALVLKDPDEERGKRLCGSGLVSQIEVERLDNGKKITHVSFVNNDMNVHRMIAIGSTGSLVSMDNGSFCGVVIGRYSYRNSGGGTTHAVRLVGMVDNKTNRSR